MEHVQLYVCTHASTIYIRYKTHFYIGLNVDIVIEYEPPYDYEHPTPPYYRPCTGVSLVCEVYGASETVTYTWTSSNSDSFINGKTERNVGVARLTSNDNGLHKCCVRDGNDNVVCANTEMIIKGILH